MRTRPSTLWRAAGNPIGIGVVQRVGTSAFRGRARMQTRRTPVRSILSIVGVILLLVACGSGEPDGSNSKVRLLKADTPRIESPDVSREQVARLVSGNNDF